MTDRPIIFSAPMIRAMLAGTKTQTRRVIQSEPGAFAGGCHPGNAPKHTAPYLDAYCGGRKTAENPRGMTQDWYWWTEDDRQGPSIGKCPFGQPGDRLWVRESYSRVGDNEDDIDVCPNLLVHAYYRADSVARELRWRPSIHMPRRASRLTLTVTHVRAQRLQDISCADAIAEGMPAAANSATIDCDMPDPRVDFQRLWNILHGPAAWDTNPWVWALTFSVEKRNIDDILPGGSRA